MNNSATSNFTVVLGKGDLLGTPQSRVNRIWYISSSGTGVKASMKLYFTKRNWVAIHSLLPRMKLKQATFITIITLSREIIPARS